jgi:hypothetical protein
MSRFKLLAFIALITLAFGVTLIGDALAGEKVKFRDNLVVMKWEQIEVGDREGHTIALYQAKGIISNSEGKPFLDRWAITDSGLMDSDSKANSGTGHGHEVLTDRDGDKIFIKWEVTTGAGIRGTHEIVGGTGKWQGIRGKGTCSADLLSPVQYYSDAEMDIEFPKR